MSQERVQYSLCFQKKVVGSALRGSLSPFHFSPGKLYIMSESGSNEPHPSRYISVPKAVQLIPKSFMGHLTELRDFI
jgi:hypothetical protein